MDTRPDWSSGKTFIKHFTSADGLKTARYEFAVLMARLSDRVLAGG